MADIEPDDRYYVPCDEFSNYQDSNQPPFGLDVGSESFRNSPDLTSSVPTYIEKLSSTMSDQYKNPLYPVHGTPNDLHNTAVTEFGSEDSFSRPGANAESRQKLIGDHFDTDLVNHLDTPGNSSANQHPRTLTNALASMRKSTSPRTLTNAPAAMRKSISPSSLTNAPATMRKSTSTCNNTSSSRSAIRSNHKVTTDRNNNVLTALNSNIKTKDNSSSSIGPQPVESKENLRPVSDMRILYCVSL